MTRKLQFIAVATLSLTLAEACSEITPLAPSRTLPLPPPPPPTGPTTLVVSGFVRTMPGRWCEGCTVEVMDGASAGTSVLTAANGQYSLSISFAGDGSSVTLQASKNGYQPATQTTRGGFVSFTLESSHPLDLTGTYDMTFEAGAQCTDLPESVRRRQYVVTLAGRSRSVFVARPIMGTFDAFEMTWHVSDKEVAMVAARGDNGEIPGIVERLGSDETINLYVFSDPAEISAGAPIRIPVIGRFEHCKGNSACSSCQWPQQHRLTMTRR